MRRRPTGLGTATSVPVSWRVVRNSALFQERRDKKHPDLEMFSVTQARGVVAQSSLESRVTAPSDDRSGYNRISPGDFVYNKMRMWQGSVGVAPAEGIVSTAYVVMAPRPCVNSRYYEYLYRTPEFIAESGRFSYGLCDDMNSLRAEHFKAMLSPAPPFEVQNRIVEYLDSETARIDSLIDRKRRFIDLLLEKRKAVITHAVTKGLDPNAEMRDSGVDWIGALPSDWRVLPIKRVACLLTGVTPPTSERKYYEQGDIPWYGPSCASDSFETRAPVKLLHRCAVEDRVARIFSAGSTLLTAIGASIGSSAFCPEPGTTNQQMVALTPRGAVIYPAFLAWAIKAMKPTFRAAASSATLPILNQSQVGAFHLPVPALSVQEHIARHLDTETAQMDLLVIKTRNSIDLLREYRTALISAAVTGQIDIPGTETTEEVA